MDGKYEIRSELRIANNSVKVYTPRSKRNRKIFNTILLICGLGIFINILLPFFDIYMGVIGGVSILLSLILCLFMLVIRFMDNDPYTDTNYKTVSEYELSVKLYSRPNKSSPHSLDSRSTFTFPLKHEWIGRLLIRGAIKSIENDMMDLEIQRRLPETLDQVHERIIAGVVVVREKQIFRSDNRFSDIEIANAND